MKYLFKMILISLLFISCSDEKYIQTYKVDKDPSIEVEKKSSMEITIINWNQPDSWKQSETNSPMRLATFQVPYYGYDPLKIDYADLWISILNGDGGGLVENVNRWRNQLNLPPQTLSQIESSAEQAENSLGTYKIFTIINKSGSDKAFVCAVIPFEDSTIFVKLDIPKVGINSVKQDFLDFCQSFERPKK